MLDIIIQQSKIKFLSENTTNDKSKSMKYFSIGEDESFIDIGKDSDTIGSSKLLDYITASSCLFDIFGLLEKKFNHLLKLMIGHATFSIRNSR